MTLEELKLGLQDILPPSEPGWWQLAPAYVVGLCLVIAVVAASWFFARYRRRKQVADLAAADLLRIKSAYSKHNDAHELTLELSKWLKQVAMLAFPEQSAAGLTGAPWLQFLDQVLGGQDFREGSGKVLGKSIYQQEFEVNPGQLLTLCERWLQALGPSLSNQTPASETGTDVRV
jgi:hypothetical protein